MRLLEMFSQYPNEYQDLSQDSSQIQYSDARKTRLTLAQINKLRKMNDMRALEHAKDMQLIQQMYNAAPQEGGLL
jgi:hypothetical protein